MAATFDPAVIVLDIDMPGMDGIETCRRLKADPTTAHIPVLVLSAYGQEWESDLLGVQGFVPKSVGMQEIVDRIRHIAGAPPLRH